MCSPSTMIVESHQSAATLYAAGDLTTSAVLEAIASVEQLPDHVRGLCVDLRSVRRTEPRALRALEMALRVWRAARRGMTRVTLAPELETSVVAIKFAHQRWRPPVRPSAEARAFRFRDYREGVVTRSLRERAGSETR